MLPARAAQNGDGAKRRRRRRRRRRSEEELDRMNGGRILLVQAAVCSSRGPFTAVYSPSQTGVDAAKAHSVKVLVGNLPGCYRTARQSSLLHVACL